MSTGKKNVFLRIVHIWWFELRRIVCSPRWIVLTFLSFFLVSSYLKEVLRFAADYDLPTVPAALPFLFADGTFNSLGMFFMVFLVSAFPVKNQLQQGVLLKGGRLACANGQMLTVLSVVALWIAEMQVFVMLLSGSRISFSGWGKVWGSVARGLYEELGYQNSIDVSNLVIEFYTPAEAVLKSMLILLLVGVIFGMAVFLLDGLSGHYIGEILLALWSLSCLVIAKFPVLAGIPFIRKISPVTWMNLESYVYYPAAYIQTVGELAAVIICLYLCSLILVMKKYIPLD